MYFQEVTEGAYRIYVGALESPVGDGYTAALVVQPRQGGRELFSDDRLSCGHRWATADDAMSFALRKGRAFIRDQVRQVA
ncbi:MAG: hypothetical protein H6933_08045 [Burkholderiaceae bacterium]|nr:hypothetical protein [Rhodoferax sp.]MCP5284834.1 hypothetical protein [Burkholderiaceae bacterium]